MFNSFGSGGPLPPPIFNGTYAFYPFATNGNNTVTAGVKINERLGDKNFVNDSGNLVTVGEYETAYTGSGELDEPSATNGVTFTDDVNGNGWVKQGAGTAINGTDGEIELDFSLPDTSFRLYQVEPPYTGEACAQVYVKAFDGESGDYVISMQETSNVITGDAVTIDDSKWYLAYVSGQFNSASAASIYFGRGDRGQTLSRVKIKYPQYVEGTLYPSSPIYNPTNAPATRDSDKAAVPTSDVWVDGGCFSGTLTSGSFNNGVSRTSNSEFTIAFDGDGKYAGKITAAVIGSVLLNNPQFTVTLNVSNSRVRASHNNLTEQELIDLFGNDGTSTNLYSIAFQYSSLTLAETTQLRADVGDTPPTEFPDGSFRWLDWPAENVAFEIDFTMLSNDPNELCHVQWVNAPKDTYAARIANNLEFNHGDDELIIPYTPPITKGETLKGYAVITPTELIGYVDGLEVSRVTRTDTQLAEWDSKCYLGGFNDTLAPVKLANLKVFDYVAPPPQTSQLIVGDFSPLSGTAGDSALLPDGSLGSLLPPVLVDGLAINFIQSVFNDFGDGAKKWILCGNNTQDFTTNLTLTFNGTSYSFVRGAIALNPNTNAIQSDALYDFLTANQNVSVDFKAEATAPVGSQLIVEQYQEPNDIGDGGYLKTSPTPVISQTPASVLFGSNQESSSITPDFLIDGVKIQAIGWTGAGAYIEFDGDLDRFQFIEMNVNGIDYLFENDGTTGSGLSEFVRFGAASLISVFEAARAASQPVTVTLNPINGSGSLNPLLSINGNEIRSLNYFAAGDVALKIDGVNLGIPAITLSLNGAEFTLEYNFEQFEATVFFIESAPLAGILSTAAASGTPIDFSAEVVPTLPDFADNGDFANNGDFDNG